MGDVGEELHLLVRQVLLLLRLHQLHPPAVLFVFFLVLKLEIRIDEACEHQQIQDERDARAVPGRADDDVDAGFGGVVVAPGEVDRETVRAGTQAGVGYVVLVRDYPVAEGPADKQTLVILHVRAGIIHRRERQREQGGVLLPDLDGLGGYGRKAVLRDGFAALRRPEGDVSNVDRGMAETSPEIFGREHQEAFIRAEEHHSVGRSEIAAEGEMPPDDIVGLHIYLADSLFCRIELGKAHRSGHPQIAVGIFGNAARAVAGQPVFLIEMGDFYCPIRGNVDAGETGSVGRSPDVPFGIHCEAGEGFILRHLSFAVRRCREIIYSEALIEIAQYEAPAAVFDDAVNERRADHIDKLEGVCALLVAVHTLPGAGIDAAVAGLHNAHTVVRGEGILPQHPAFDGIERSDAVAVRCDPKKGSYPRDVGDGGAEGYACLLGEILEDLGFRVEAAEESFLASDPDEAVGIVADSPDGVADKAVGRVVGDETAETFFIGHPAAESTVPGAGPHVAEPVLGKATDAFRSEGGDTYLVGELLLQRARDRIVDQKTVSGADPIKSVVVQQALDLSFVEDHVGVDYRFSGSACKVDDADFVHSVAGKQARLADALHVTESGLAAVGPDRPDVSGDCIQKVNPVVKGGEGDLAVVGDAGAVRGEG